MTPTTPPNKVVKPMPVVSPVMPEIPKPTQPQEEVKVVPMQSSGVNVNKEALDKKMHSEFVSGLDKPSMDYAQMSQMLNEKATKQRSEADAAKEEKRRKSKQLINTIGDGLSALSNLYFTTKGAPSVQYDPRGSLSARSQARWDEIDKNRNAEEYKQYMLNIRKRELDLKKAQEERMTQKMQNDANYQEGSLALRGAAEEGKNWRTQFTEGAKNQRQGKTIEGQNKRAEESNKTKVQVAQINQAGQNQRAAQKQKDNSVYFGKNEWLDIGELDDDAASSIYSEFPENIKAAAEKDFAQKDNLGRPKSMTPTQMRQAIGKYLKHEDAEAARSVARSKKGYGKEETTQGSKKKSAGRFGKGVGTSNMKPLTGVE